MEYRHLFFNQGLKECDPLKSMFWMLPHSIVMCIVGFFFWCILEKKNLQGK